MRKRGQAATEYAMVALMIGLLVVPAIYLFFTYSRSSVREADTAQLDKLGRDIVEIAEKVYYMGPPSRLQLNARLPQGVRNISVMQDWENGVNLLIFNVTTEAGVQTLVYPSSVNINGTFYYALENRSISPGLKTIHIEAYETVPDANGVVTPFVYVNFGGRCPTSATYNLRDGSGAYSPIDAIVFNGCYCNYPGAPKYRPTETWQDGWFVKSDGLPFPWPYAVCMNADYDGDCDVDDADQARFCAETGQSCGAITC